MAHPRELVGDEAPLFTGCRMPVIPRQRLPRSSCYMVGHAYVDDILNNKLWSTMNMAKLVDVGTW